MPSISVSKGKGSFNHNERKYSTPNVDAERTHLNVVLQPNRIKEVYHELFDQALLNYNAKQKRSDRKIDDYYSHINHSKKEKAFHELVIQVGNMNDQCSASNEILKEYFEGFEKRNPQMKVVAAVIHNDEKTPHLHLDYVPFVTGQKRGLETKVANDKAMKQMGYDSFIEWKNNEMNALEEALKHHGLERTVMNNTDRHRSVSGYKMEQRLIEQRLEQLDQQSPTTPIEVKKSLLGAESVKKSDYDLVTERNKLLEAKLAVLSDSNKKYEQELVEIKNKSYIASNKALEAEVEEWKANCDEAVDRIVDMEFKTVPIDQYQKLEKQYREVLPYRQRYMELKQKYEPVEPKSVRERIKVAQQVQKKKSVEELEREVSRLNAEVERWKKRFAQLVGDLGDFIENLRTGFGYFISEAEVDDTIDESINASFEDIQSILEVSAESRVHSEHNTGLER